MREVIQLFDLKTDRIKPLCEIEDEAIRLTMMYCMREHPTKVVSEAARLLKIGRSTLYRRIEKMKND